MIPISLKERSIVVTGASGGLGSVVCRVLLDAGAHLTAADRSMGTLAQDLGNPENARFIEGSVFDPEEVNALFEAAPAPIHGLVNIVGGYTGGPRLHETDLETVNRMHTFNVHGTFLCTQAALTRMLESDTPGRIVNISAIAADRAPAGHFAYAAAKSAVLKLTEAAAAEYADTGITINAIQPGTIRTPANLRAMPDANHDAWVSPEEIAHTIAFLLSDLASGINGSALRLTGRS